MGRNYWMVVQSKNNFDVSSAMDFEVHGLRRRQRRRAERMQTDDRVLYYISTIRKWAATATITSHFYEDRSRIWDPASPGEEFPYRVKLTPNFVLAEADFIDALELGPRLDYVKRWAPEDWPLAFFDSLHLLPQRDFKLIEGEMRRIVSRRPDGRGGRSRRGRRGRGRAPRPGNVPAPAEAQPVPGDGLEAPESQSAGDGSGVPAST